jgi:outer membrane receptor for ferrienterochelin and colicins
MNKWLLGVIFGCLMVGLVKAEDKKASESPEDILWQEIPEVVTAAAKHEQKTSEAPAAITIITDKDIKKYGYQTLADALRGVRGFFINNDRNYGYLGVRGFCIPGDYNSRVLILVNGYSTNNIIYGESFIDPAFLIDLTNVKRIEIVRGPGSALYGANAVFAVINIITRDGGDLNGIETSAQVGSFGMNKGILTYGVKSSDGFKILASLSALNAPGQDLYYKEFDTPSTNSGWAEHADKEEAYNFFLTATYDKFTLQTTANSRTKHIPTPPWDLVFNDDRAQTIDNSGFMELKYANKLDDTKELVSRIYYENYSYNSHYPYISGTSTTIPYERDTGGNHGYGLETQMNWTLPAQNLLTLGLEYQKQLIQQKTSTNVDGTFFDDERYFRSWSIYLQDEYTINKQIKLIPGWRYDNYTNFGDVNTPRLALLYTPFENNQTVLKLLYGEAFRVPNAYEMYYTDDYDSVKPNLDLKPEKTKTYELAREQQLNKNLKGIISLYQWQIKDLITEVLDPADGLIQYQNIDKIRARGIELGVVREWSNGVKVHVDYALQKTEDLTYDAELVNSPRDNAQIGISWPLVKDKTFLSAEMQYLGRRLTLADNYTDPSFVTNLTFYAKEIGKGMDVSMSIYNLFDEKYTSVGGPEHLQDEIPQDGRSFLFQLTYRF